MAFPVRILLLVALLALANAQRGCRVISWLKILKLVDPINELRYNHVSPKAPWIPPALHLLIKCIQIKPTTGSDEVGEVLIETIERPGSNNLAALWAIEEALQHAKSSGVQVVAQLN